MSAEHGTLKALEEHGRRVSLAGSRDEPDMARASEMAPVGKGKLRIAIGIATLGRGPVLVETMKRLALQTRPADCVLICTPLDEPVAEETRKSFEAIWITSPKGSSHQRNAIIEALTDYDIVLFMDDDFVPAPDYVGRLEELFCDCPDIVLATGGVLRDGVVGPGLSFAEADQVIAENSPFACDNESALTPVFNGYGCNMAVRLGPVRRLGVRFDENLPLYAWLEDIDFSRQLAPDGRIVRDRRLRGVHLGAKAGRQSGYRLGYSQIANPVFLVRKGTCPLGKALYLMSRNITANLLRSFRPEPWVDRTGRARGNVLALIDLLRGRLRPDRILDLQV